MQVLQGYDCDIVHIPGKDNPADFLTRRSIQELRSMADVRAEEESLVQRLKLHEGDKGENEIQKNLMKFLRSQELGKQWWLLVRESTIHFILYILCW